MYVVGMFILALGLTLNTKANLGVSPIISVPYSISQITGLNFGDLTFCGIRHICRRSDYNSYSIKKS